MKLLCNDTILLFHHILVLNNHAKAHTLIIYSILVVKFLNYLLEAFATLPSHINYLHPNIEYIMILYFYHNLSCICY